MWSPSSSNPDESQKAYLLQALYDWMEDGELIPEIYIANPKRFTRGLPSHLLEEDLIKLNISSTATHNLDLTNQTLFFDTRFGGQHHSVAVALGGVVGLIARGSDQGIQFSFDAGADAQWDDSPDPDNDPPPTPPHLKIIK